MDKKRKSSNVASLILHVIVIWAAFSFKSAHIMVPSRSNGMEVSLITPEELNSYDAPSKIVSQLNNIEPVKSAEINLKDNKKPTPIVENPKPTIAPKPVAKIPPKTVDKPKLAKTVHAVKKKNPANNQVNDLLNDLSPSKSSGKSKNSATGGSDSGTADTNNLIGNYADKVIAAVRPYVLIPPDVNGNNVAIVEVTLLPNLQVYSVNLIKSSGSSEYDQSVQDAINRVGTFPDLPDGAKFTDYRTLKLTFKPE